MVCIPRVQCAWVCAHGHVCGNVQARGLQLFLLLDGPAQPSDPPKRPIPQKLRLLHLTAHLRGCFLLSTTVPKNVNKPRLGHLGYTFSENSLAGGVGSVHWMALPRVETGPPSAQPVEKERFAGGCKELGSFLHPEVLPQVPCPHTQTQHPPAFRKKGNICQNFFSIGFSGLRSTNYLSNTSETCWQRKPPSLFLPAVSSPSGRDQEVCSGRSD